MQFHDKNITTHCILLSSNSRAKYIYINIKCNSDKDVPSLCHTIKFSFLQLFILATKLKIIIRVMHTHTLHTKIWPIDIVVCTSYIEHRLMVCVRSTRADSNKRLTRVSMCGIAYTSPLQCISIPLGIYMKISFE